MVAAAVAAVCRKAALPSLELHKKRVAMVMMQRHARKLLGLLVVRCHSSDAVYILWIMVVVQNVLL